MKTHPSHSKIRVFLVDDHPIVRRGFQLLLSMEPDIMVCGDADAGPWRSAVVAHVRQTVEDKLRVANPKYLGLETARKD